MVPHEMRHHSPGVSLKLITNLNQSANFCETESLQTTLMYWLTINQYYLLYNVIDRAKPGSCPMCVTARSVTLLHK